MKEIVRSVAEERIAELLRMAEERTKERGSSSLLAKRYVQIARQIGKHYKISMPAESKGRICKKCNSFLVPGINCTVRISGKSAIYACNCGNGVTPAVHSRKPTSLRSS